MKPIVITKPTPTTREHKEPPIEPKPTLATVAAQLVCSQNSGTLASNSVKHPGFPHSSAMPFATDQKGNLIFLISSMAVHSKNLRADDRASLLIEQSAVSDLSEARLTIIGKISQLDGSSGVGIHSDSIHKTYVRQHPQAEQWASFADFQYVQLQPLDLYLVGGFGSMGWISPDEYQQAVESWRSNQ